MKLSDKNAIVTGSTKGIGLSVAHSLLAQGANVVISSRNQQEIDQTVQRLAGVGPGRVVGKCCDVRNENQVIGLIDTCVREFGGLDILINNAGIGIFRSVEELTSQEWGAVIETNLNSLFYACHYGIPEMKKRGGGFIISIGSLAGKNAFPLGAAYNASKFGLIGFSEALMQEVRHDDIRVAYIMPGSVDTWFGGKPPSEADSWKLSPEDVAEVVLDTLQRSPRCLTSRIEMRPAKPQKK